MRLTPKARTRAREEWQRAQARTTEPVDPLHFAYDLADKLVATAAAAASLAAGHPRLRRERRVDAGGVERLPSRIPATHDANCSPGSVWTPSRMSTPSAPRHSTPSTSGSAWIFGAHFAPPAARRRPP